MSESKKLVDFLKNQVKVENMIVESLNNSVEDMTNPAVKGVLKGISLDSMKHADMYASAINLLTSVPPALTQEQLDTQRELVQKHIVDRIVPLERQARYHLASHDLRGSPFYLDVRRIGSNQKEDFADRCRTAELSIREKSLHRNPLMQTLGCLSVHPFDEPCG